MFVEHKEVGEVKELDEPSQLLLKAADLIERRGWCQNRLCDEEGRLCINGAILAAYGKGLCESQLYGTALEAAVRISKTVDRIPAHSWNDKFGRTKEEVVAKLRAVALGHGG